MILNLVQVTVVLKFKNYDTLLARITLSLENGKTGYVQFLPSDDSIACGLEKIAADIVTHFLARGYQGKVMVISIDRFTAVKMYDKVQHYWQLHLNELKAQQAQSNISEFEQKQLRFFRWNYLSLFL